MRGRGSRWWMWPLWVLQLATGAKSFVDNPIIGSPALNRRGLHAARVKWAARLASWRRRMLASQIEPKDRAAFERDGFVRIDNFLPEAEFEALRRYLLDTPMLARDHRQGNAITRRVPVDPALLRECPALHRLIDAPRWRGLMHYVGSNRGQPLYYLQTIISGEDGPDDPQLDLHSDSFQPSLKAWYFLSDVAEEDGPLTYVAGSHRAHAARLAWERQRSLTVLDDGDRLSQRGSLRIDPSELAALGLGQPTHFAVPANTLVVADTFGFHARGRAARPSVRVELWAYRRRNPFLPFTGLNLLSIGGIAHRRVQWSYRLGDWLAAKGWRQQHWTPTGPKRATDR